VDGLNHRTLNPKPSTGGKEGLGGFSPWERIVADQVFAFQKASIRPSLPSKETHLSDALLSCQAKQ
jgi:hypothetical protein